MPDWNPAGIIGLRRARLALTLYKEVITDAVWAYMRHNYGYRIFVRFPSWSRSSAFRMSMFVSFNSFIEGCASHCRPNSRTTMSIG